MGLFERIFGPVIAKMQRVNSGGDLFQALTAYRPAFTTWNGRLYENELIRAVVDARARHMSKLKVEFTGSARQKLKTQMKSGPNEWMTWPTFLYRLSTIWDVCDTAFIIPVLDEYDQTIGFFPAMPQSVEVMDVEGVTYLRYTFATGKKAAIELSRCAVLPKHQFRDDFFGEGNGALDSTMQLLNMQHQGIREGIKNSATFRFMAKLSNFAKPEDLAKESKRFNHENLRGESGGLLLFPSTYADIKQIEQKPFVVDAEQTKLIQQNVFNYFGVNEKILQNSAMGDEMDAFFDGGLEPLMILISDTMTRITYSQREILGGNKVTLTANRLQYMSTQNKINLAKEMADRGVLMIDEIRELFNYQPLPDGKGQHTPARGEYYLMDVGKEETITVEPKEDEDTDG